MPTTVPPFPADPPAPPHGRLEIHELPVLPSRDGTGGVLTNAIPMLGSLGSIALVATMGSTTPAGQARSLLAAGMFVVTTLGLVVAQLDRQRRQRTAAVHGRRMEYLRHLGTVRTIVREAAAQQRTAQVWRHPDPAALPALAEERSRIWERPVTDPEFLQVRYGVCAQQLSLDLVPPDAGPSDRVDPVAASALHRLLAVHRQQPDLPVTVDLRAWGGIEIVGTVEEARSLARALVCSAAAFHSPQHLAIAVLSSQDARADWDWAKWLPHAGSTEKSDVVGPRRLVSASPVELAALLPPAPVEDRHLLLVVDGAELCRDETVIPGLAGHGVTVLELARPGAGGDDSRLRLMIEEGTRAEGRNPVVTASRPGRSPAPATADQCDRATADAFARRLAPLSPLPVAGGDLAGAGPGRVRPPDVADLLGLGDVHRYDATSAWHGRPARDRLRVPIGLDEAGEVVRLDLKESAQLGMGPHGLVVGATGSGKSELLRTLVLGLALTHSPDELNMVLVDFKGGATFAGMSAMPHVSAVITNLADELTLVDRMQDALSGEMVRRQELLRDAGRFASMHDYERARAAGAQLAPLPSLLIVVDEFSEMLSAKPEFLDLFVAIGRLGRSLGLHLLLASQRLDEGRLRGLESHLAYRIGLRTFSAQESRTVLGVPDAYELPPTPGLGYLRADQSTLLRFTAAYVSGPVARARHTLVPPTGSQPFPEILPWTTAEVRAPVSPEPAAERRCAAGEPSSLLDVAVSRMAGLGPVAHQVWLPPLDVPDTLDRLMPDLSPDPEHGLVSREWRARGGLTVPIGTVDRPREQRRDTLTVDLSGAAGHVAVVGGPRTGKSTVLRTLVASLSLTTTPLESQFFVLDFGGGTFAGLRSLPHLAGLATRSEPDVVRRIVAEVAGILDRRETYFRAHAVDSIETYRRRRVVGRADDGYGDVFLVVDGWGTMRADFDDLEPDLQQLATRGLTYGIHVLTATSRWADYRAAVRDVCGTRLELRLGDPLDSEIDRRLAAVVPPSRPCRGLLPAGLHFLAALPRVDGDGDVATLGPGVEALADQVAAAWTGPSGPKLRLLPGRLTVDDLLARADGRSVSSTRLLLGVDEKELAPVGLDPDSEPHWLVFGDARSGKSAALRTFVHEVMRTRTPQQAQLVVVDYRRSLVGEVPSAYLLNYLTSAAQATAALTGLASYLHTRIPGPDVTPAQLRNRSWWTGAEVFIVVDDYDLVATTTASPVQVLQPLLAQARDVGLHLAVARRAGGASRALYEPVIQALRDLAVPGLLLSGSPDEGPLIGHVRPAPMPPGRGRLVTRERGTEVVQLAWREPSL